MRAVARIDTPTASRSFYAQWGSPDYKLPALGEWLATCRITGTTPDATDYLTATAASAHDHFTEPHTGRLPGDLDWLYEICVVDLHPTPDGGGDEGGGVGPAWGARIVVRGPRLWSLPKQPHGLQLHHGPTAHCIEITEHDFSQLAAAITTAAADQVATIRRHGVPGPDTGKITTQDAIDWWDSVAAAWADDLPPNQTHNKHSTP